MVFRGPAARRALARTHNQPASCAVLVALLQTKTRGGFPWGRAALGESCTIISDAGGLAGKFTKVTGTKAGKGLVYAVGCTPTSVTLTVKS